MGHLDICQVLLDAHADASALADISNASCLHMLLRCESLLQGTSRTITVTSFYHD
jgi:hypothetical protein